MTRIVAALLMLLAAGATAVAASVVNRDDEPRTLIVTEGGRQYEMSVDPGQTVQFCRSGCFVTMPNGDRDVLTGAEAIEISGGRGRIR